MTGDPHSRIVEQVDRDAVIYVLRRKPLGLSRGDLSTNNDAI
jgi:hypothetical protein